MAGDGRPQIVDSPSGAREKKPSAEASIATARALKDAGKPIHESLALQAAKAKAREARAFAAQRAKQNVLQELARLDRNDGKRNPNTVTEPTLAPSTLQPLGEAIKVPNNPTQTEPGSFGDFGRERQRIISQLGLPLFDRLTRIDNSVAQGGPIPAEVGGYLSAMNKLAGVEKSRLHKLWPGREGRLGAARAEVDKQFDALKGVLVIPPGTEAAAKSFLDKIAKMYEISGDRRKFQAESDKRYLREQKQNTENVLDALKHSDIPQGLRIQPLMGQIDRYLARIDALRTRYPSFANMSASQLDGLRPNEMTIPGEAHAIEEANGLFRQLGETFGKDNIGKIISAKMSQSARQRAA